MRATAPNDTEEREENLLIYYALKFYCEDLKKRNDPLTRMRPEHHRKSIERCRNLVKRYKPAEGQQK